MRNGMQVERLKSHVQDALPSHYMPNRFVQCQAFPITPHGKLDKRKLLSWGRVEEPGLDLSSTSPLSVSTQLWQIFLPSSVQEINLEDTFLSLGGDSLTAVNLVNYLEHHFGKPAQHFMDLLVNKDFSSFIEYLSSFILKKDNSRVNFVKTEFLEKIGMASEDEENGKKDFEQACGNVDSTETINYETCGQDNTKYVNVHNIGKQGERADVSNYVKETPVSGASKKINDSCGFYVICRGNKMTQVDQESKSFNNLFHDTSHHGFFCDECNNSETNKHLCKKCERRWRQDTFETTLYDLCDRSLSDNSRNAPQQCVKEYTGKKKRHREKIVHDPDFREGESAPTKSLHLRWSVDTEKCVDASPVILVSSHMKGIAFIGSHSGHFSAVDVHNGETKWTTVLSDRIESSANICQNFTSVIVGCYDGFLYLMDIKSGDIEWKFQTGESVKCSPCAIGDHVICGSHDGWLYSLNIEARKCKWRHHLGGGSIFSSPLVDLKSGLVYAASLSGRLVALDLHKGELVWCVELKKPLFSSPCCHGQSILIGCVDGELYCVNGGGHILWTFQTQGPIFSSPVSQDGFVFFGCHDNSFYYLTSTGQLVWRFDAASPIFSTPFLFYVAQKRCNSTSNIENLKEKKAKKSLVVFASMNGSLYVLDSFNGSVVASTHLPGEVFSSPVVHEEHIVVGCRDNFLYCFDVSL